MQRGTTELILILTQTADVTLLPGSRSAGGRYKNSVGILDEWNGKREVAREWGHGTVYLDTNAFVTNAFVTGSFMRRVHFYKKRGGRDRQVKIPFFC